MYDAGIGPSSNPAPTGDAPPTTANAAPATIVAAKALARFLVDMLIILSS